MTKELSGRVAIVTGAGRNIGRAIALALADGGAAVVVNARSNLQEAEAVAGEIERGGGAHEPLTCGDIEEKFALNARHGEWDAARTQSALALMRTMFDGRIDLSLLRG